MTNRRNGHSGAAAMSGLAILGGAALALTSLTSADAHDELPAHHVDLPQTATPAMKAFWADRKAKDALSDVTSSLPDAPGAVCEADGFARPAGHEVDYECAGIDLQSFLSLDSIGGTRTNSSASDIWGWADAGTGKEYAIIGRVFGTSFVDVTVPSQPVFLGELPTHGAFGSTWRDVKVYNNHAFIVSEALNHGMQVFDLTQLLTMDGSGGPVTFAETAHYNKVASAHNIAINEDSGFAYVVGASGKNSCSGGIHMVNIGNPNAPTFAGCFSQDGYTHDVQCVNYAGPDADYSGREICLAANEDTVTIVDVTDKGNPSQVSRTPYNGSAYTHQGWLTPDHEWFVVDDELDEQDFGHGTRTRFFDVSDLDQPVLDSDFTSTSSSIDHNLYMTGGCAVQANYQSGLRVLRSIDGSGLFDPASAAVTAYFDTYPNGDAPDFNGAWSSYPYLPSGNIVVSGIEQGLYVLKPQTDLTADCALAPSSGNESPVVTITQPTQTSFVEGDVVIFEATVTDAEDEPDPTVSSWDTSTGENLGSGNTSDPWTPPVGTHTVTATATDTDGAVGQDSITITVDPQGGGNTIYVADLSGLALSGNGRRWTAEVTIEITNGTSGVQDASVSGTWSDGAKGSASCTTGATGFCTVSKSAKSGTAITFTVDSVTHPTLTYDAGSNVESTITVTESAGSGA